MTTKAAAPVNWCLRRLFPSGKLELHPTQRSILSEGPGGGTGRRAAFRMLCPNGRGGSSPLQGTLGPCRFVVLKGFRD